MTGDPKYKTSKWRKFRDAILARDEYTCQECKRKGTRTTAQVVHHVVPFVDEWFYRSDNVISLCMACHNKMHVRRSDELTDTGSKWIRLRQRGKIKSVI